LLGVAAKYCVDPQVSLDEHIRLRLAVDEPTPAALTRSRTQVTSDWDRLVEAGVAERAGEFLDPKLDEVARVYLKYRAAALSVLPPLAEGTYADRLTDLIFRRIRGAAEASGFGSGAMFPVRHVTLSEGREAAIGDEVRLLEEGDIDTITMHPRLIGFLADTVPEAVDDTPAGYAVWAIPFEVRENGAVGLVVMPTEDGDKRIAEFDSAIATLFRAAQPYGAESGLIDHAYVSRDDWEMVKIGTRAFMADLSMKNGFGQADAARLQEIGEATLAILPEKVKREPRLESVYLLLNDLAFIRLTRGHIVEAFELFERCAAAGGLDWKRTPSHRAILLTNLAACAAGTGKYVEAAAYADDAMAAVAAGSDEAQAGWLVVYRPDPEWPKKPTLVQDPDVSVVALATKAGALAAVGDREALSLATDVLELCGEPWARDVVRSVEQRLAS
jgi:hypothetical protein